MVKKSVKYLIPIGILLPIVSLIYLTFVKQWVFPKLWDVNFTIEHWKNIIGEGSIIISCLKSFVIACTVSLIITSTTFVITKKLLLDYSLNTWLKWAFYPYIIAPVVWSGMLQYYFIKFGLTGSMMGVILSQLLFLFPYGITFFSIFWNQKISQFTHIALTLGTPRKEIYKQILIPLGKPFIMFCLLQCFVISWFEFGITKVIGVGKVDTLIIKMMDLIKSSNPHFAALSGLFLIVPVWIIVFLFFISQKRVFNSI